MNKINTHMVKLIREKRLMTKFGLRTESLKYRCNGQ